VAQFRNKWYEKLDEQHMTATAEVWDEDGDEMEVEVPFKWEVCSLCNGNGKHVNPSIDAHGITSEEFAEDPEFFNDYRSGIYDVACYECAGLRVVAVPDEGTENGKLALEKMRQLAEWAREDAHAARMGY